MPQSFLVPQFDALPRDWQPLAQAFLASPKGAALCSFLDGRAAAGATIYPPRPLRALELVPPGDVRIVILGQDPYHGAGQAHGLAFSVPDGVRPPPSLRNIFLELKRDPGCAVPASGNLERWARQGVLLLNAALTVEAGRPASHAGRGWESFTDAVIDALAHDARPKVFMLWGAHAQAREPRIAADRENPQPLTFRPGERRDPCRAALGDQVLEAEHLVAGAGTGNTGKPRV